MDINAWSATKITKDFINQIQDGKDQKKGKTMKEKYLDNYKEECQIVVDLMNRWRKEKKMIQIKRSILRMKTAIKLIEK